MRRYKIVIFILLLAGSVGAVDNTATMGSRAEDFPSLRIFRSGNAYDDAGDFISGVSFWGRNAARISAGQGHEHPSGRKWFDSLKVHASIAGRTLLTEAYSDFMFYVECGNAKVDYGVSFDYGNAQTHNFWYIADSLSLIWDDLFFVLADDSDSVVYALRTASCVGTADPDRKWANVDLPDSQKYQSQFGTYNNPSDNNYPATDAQYMNYTDTINYALMKSHAYLRLKDSGKLFSNLDSTMDGFTFDNSHPDSWRSPNYVHSPGNGYSWWSFGGNTGGAIWSYGAADIDWVGYDAPFVIGGPNYTILGNAWSASFNIMLDTMKDMGISTSCNYVNGSPSGVESYAARHGEPVTTLFFEFRGNDLLYKTYATITAPTGSNAELSRVDSAILYNIPHVNEFRSFGGFADDTSHAWAAHSYLCAHMTYQDTALTYFCFQNWKNGSAADGDSMYLANWGLFKLDYGDVLNERQYVDTGTTVDGDPIHLFWREYENAYVLWYPPDALTDDTALTNYYEWDCGQPVYELGRSSPGHVDSTYRANGKIRISPRHGVVAWKLGSEAPPSISDILPTSSYKDSTDAVTATIEDDYGIDSIFNYVWHPDSTPGVHDSISIWDTVFSAGVLLWSPSHNYTWPDSGDFYIVFAAKDDSLNWTRDSIQILADVAHNPPVISNIAPVAAYRDSTDSIMADITDNAGVDSIWSYVRNPNGDSIHVADSVLSPISASFHYSHEYTWLDSGLYWLVFVAKDEEVSETRDSLQILVSVQGVAVDAITFDYSTGMIDAHGRAAGNEDNNYGNNTIIYNSDFYYHAIIGDYSMDDSLSTSWTIDSGWFVWNSEGVGFYSASDTTYMYLVMVTDDRDWVELEMTWNSWNALNLWTNPGGDYLSCISDTIIITSTSHPIGTIDTISIHPNTADGGMWLDSVKYSTGNFGFMIINEPVGTSTGNELVYMRSTENATVAYRPWIRIFPHISAVAALETTIWQGIRIEKTRIQP